MPKYYFLSRLIGSGTQLDPFRPLAVSLGPSDWLDLRPDKTRPDGWCFACVEREDPISPATAAELLYLGDDEYVELSDAILHEIKGRLGINFKSQKLAEIVAEILLCQLLPGRGLRPGVDGKYRIYLRGLLWEATEVEAYELVGRLREVDLLTPTPCDTSSLNDDLRPALGNALTTLASIVDQGRPGWLRNEIQRVKDKKSKHPLVTNYVEATSVCEASDAKCIHESPAALWALMLAHDLCATSQYIDIERLSSRLRNPNDCEPAKYELYVMAGYIEAGVRVEKTDADSMGEFRVFEGSQHVHVECKYKSIERMAQRRVKAVFDNGDDRFRELMEKKSTKALVQISCRTDPSEEDLPKLLACVSRALEHDIGETGLQFQCSSKFEVSFLPGIWVTADSGVRLPTGFDYGFAEATVEKDSMGKTRPGRGWGVAWRVLRPGGWMRSVVESFRQAASQVPADSPNLIYIHVPAGGLGAVTTRIDSVVPEIEDLLSNPGSHKRVNAVVLTGQATLRGWSAPKVTTVKFIYRIVANRNPRNALPSNFRIFGRDFTRK